MMRTKRYNRTTDAVFTLLLFAVFAVVILSVLLTGAEVYQRLSERYQLGYEQRTAQQYLTTRIRQADRAGAVSAEDFAGCPALLLTEEIDGRHYTTRIYAWDGYIRELFSAAGEEFLPEDGEKVVKGEELLVELDGSGLQLSILTEDGCRRQLQLYLRSGGGDLP